MDNKKNENIKELLLQKEKEGKVVWATVDGLMTADLEKFIKQPTEGILYDLNRDRATVLTWMDEDRWVNDLAVGLVIGKLKELIDKSDRTC